MPLLQSQDKDMNKLIPAHPFPTGKYTAVDFPDEPMEKETEIDDYRHQNKADEFQKAYKKVVSEYDDERDDEHIHEDEGCYCHDDFYLRVNDYVCKLLLL